MTLTEKLARLLADLDVFDDPQERLTAVIDRARRLAPLPISQRTDDHRVRGCVSVVWLACELRAGRCYFHGEAESPVVRGLIALLSDFFSGATPAEILASDLDPPRRSTSPATCLRPGATVSPPPAKPSGPLRRARCLIRS